MAGIFNIKIGSMRTEEEGNGHVQVSYRMSAELDLVYGGLFLTLHIEKSITFQRSLSNHAYIPSDPCSLARVSSIRIPRFFLHHEEYRDVGRCGGFRKRRCCAPPFE